MTVWEVIELLDTVIDDADPDTDVPNSFHDFQTAARIRAQWPEHDWFHLPKNEVVEGRRFDHERLVADVIAPFRVGTQKLTFYRYNWGYLTGEPDGFHETPITIAHKEILIIEGCETLHSALYPHLDLRIWLDTSPKVALERGMRRDVEEYKLDPERVRAAWAEWSSWEEKRLSHDDRRMRADFILNFSKD